MGHQASAPENAGLRQSIMRLAQFRPFGAGQLQIEATLRELVLTAAHEAGDQGLPSLAACRAACRTLWGVEIEIDELRPITAALNRQGKLANADGVFRLTPSARQELDARITQSDQAEGEAFADWEVAVRGLAAWIRPAQLDRLRDDLVTWLQQIVMRHGVEAAMLLYPEDDRGARVLAEIGQFRLDFLPDREAELQQLRPQALYLFVHRPTPSQRAYLANLMTTAYTVASFTLDPRAAAHLQALTTGQRVYLDTNIVYAALNLQGPQAYLSASRILKLTRDLGYEVAVTPWTVEEMKQSLRRARKDLAKTTLPPRALAEIAAEATGEESFVTAYWRKYKDTGVTVEDFSAMYLELDALIERLGITITSQGCTAIDQNVTAINEQVALIERFPGGQFKPEPVKVHDVKHRLLVERMRGDGNRHFSNAGYWFLTLDSVLIPYGRAERPSADALPFAISMTAWAHIVRSFTPRTTDYDQTLVDLLDTPSLRPRGVVAFQTVADVLGRVDLMVTDSSEDVASRLLLDHATMTDIEGASGEARSTKIEQAITTKTDEMRRQLAEAESARVDAEAARAAEEAARAVAEHEAAAVKAQLTEHREQVGVLSDEVTAERDARAEAERAAEESRIREAAAVEQIEATQQAHTDEISALRGELRRHQTVARRIIASVLLVLALAVTIVPLATSWVSGGWGWVGIVAAGAGIAFLALWLLLSWKRAAAIAGVAAFVIGGASDLHGVAPKAHQGSTPPSGSSK
jgi:hypothetical protein